MSFGEVSTVDLVPGGSKVKVTKDSCRDYIKAYLQYLFHDSVKKQFDAFRQGFMKVCNGRVIVSVSACMYVRMYMCMWALRVEMELYLVCKN